MIATTPTEGEKWTGETLAQAWEDMKRTYQSAYADIGNTYQQILMSGGLHPDRTSLNYEIAESSYQVNPEYTEMERAYAGQEQEKAEMWKGYEQWRDEQPEYQSPRYDLEPER